MPSPLGEFRIELDAALRRERKRDLVRRGLIHLEPMPPEMCGATPDGNDVCTLEYCHKGPHNWKREEE